MDAQTRETRYRLVGLHCADCAATVERVVRRLPGVLAAEAAYPAGVLTVRHADAPDPAAVLAAVRRVGYDAVPWEADRAAHEWAAPGGVPAEAAPARSWWHDARTRWTVVSGVALLAAGAAARAGSPAAATALWAAAMAAGGWHPARAGLAALRAARVTMNALMAAAAVGAAAIGQWAEGATVVFLFSVGELLEAFAAGRSRRAIRALMALAPEQAERLRAGRVELVPASAVQPGDRLAVRTGARVPVDGVVVAGTASVDESAVTGESLPVDKAPGDPLLAGTVNVDGYVEMEARKPAGESLVARVIRMVEEAQAARAPVQRFVDRFAAVYTPLVAALAACVALLPPLLGDQPAGPWLYRALALLVLACPCALVLATPTAIAAALAAAARHGILVKGGASLEALARVRVVALDKTGTLTEGRLAVAEVVAADGRSPAEVLSLAAGLEARAAHPVARAVVAEAAARNLTPPPVEAFTAHRGLGVSGVVHGRRLYLGSPRYVAQCLGALPAPWESILARLEGDGRSVVLLADDKEVLGALALADRVRPGAAATVDALRAAGVTRLVLLTGDRPPAARAVAARLGLDQVRAGLLPEDKVAAVAALEAAHGPVAMVGDGVNDAPALARATVGVAMGAAGTDAALETAGVALMGDDLARLPEAIRLARRALRVVRQNIAFALGVKVLAVAALAAGRLTLWLAVLADTGAALVVTANALRLLAAPRAARRPPRAPCATMGGGSPERS